MQKVDYLIVGQGIVGTLLAWFLEKAGKSYILFDNGQQQAASKVAAGLINPITGRRFVKSWMIETLLPFAKQTYQEMEAIAESSLWKEVPIVRYFQTTAEGNNWLSKTSYDGYEQFLSQKKLPEYLHDVIKDTGGYGIINGAQVNVGLLVQYFRQAFLDKKILINQAFDYQQLQFVGEEVMYGEWKAKSVLFCEGYSASQNPWFNHLPYESAKGEVLMLRIPNLHTDFILKKTQFLVSIEKDLFWFGSNYEWEDLTDYPTKEGKAYLEERLKDILQLEYSIVDHIAAVRPILKDRRPAIGWHPDYPQLGFLNGMGTKGTSIAPYWVHHFVEHLVHGTALSEEVTIARFFEEPNQA